VVFSFDYCPQRPASPFHSTSKILIVSPAVVLAFAFTAIAIVWWRLREKYITALSGFAKSRKGARRIFRFNFIAMTILLGALWWAVLNR
jgi:hypothetical protein